MAISRNQNPRQLEDGVKALIGEAYDEIPEDYLRVFGEVNSERAWEEYPETETFGVAPITGEGTIKQMDHASELWTHTVRNQKFALGFALTEEAFADNRAGNLATRYSRFLARSIKEAKAIRAARPFNDGFGSFTTGEGVSLFSSSHNGADGDQSNILGTPADLDHDSLETLLVQINEAEDYRGNKIGLRPRYLLVPPSEEFAAERLLNSALRPGTANNDLNAVRTLRNMEVVVMKHLTDSDAWFVVTDLPDGEGAIYQKRQAMTPKSYIEQGTDNMVFTATERCEFYVLNWRGVYGTAGAA